MATNVKLRYAQTRTYKDPVHPDVVWTVLDGPFKDEDDETYFEFTGSNGCEGQGYIKTYGIVEIVNEEYYGD